MAAHIEGYAIVENQILSLDASQNAFDTIVHVERNRLEVGNGILIRIHNFHNRIVVRLVYAQIVWQQ